MALTPERFRQTLVRTAMLIEEAKALRELAREAIHAARNTRNWTGIARELSRRARKANGSAH